MRLLVVSHTPHYRLGDGVVGWGPTVREIDQLAQLFDEVQHVAPLHPEEAPASALPYENPRVRFRPVIPSGGEASSAKLGILAAWPGYFRAIREGLETCDVVHVRCPSNIGLLATLMLALRARPVRRWIKYAGNWNSLPREPWTYALQRKLLTWNVARAEVTINGDWPHLPEHVHPFLNPCLTLDEIGDGRRVGVAKTLTPRAVRFLFAGLLDEAKGCDRAIAIVDRLREDIPGARLDVVGDGPQRQRLEALTDALALRSIVSFRGWLPRPRLADAYELAHFLLLPSETEGWPKVVGEAMAYGVVPLTSDAGSLPLYLGRFRVGRTCAARDVAAFVRAVREYLVAPDLWKTESGRALQAVEGLSYATYLTSIDRLLHLGAA